MFFALVASPLLTVGCNVGSRLDGETGDLGTFPELANVRTPEEIEHMRQKDKELRKQTARLPELQALWVANQQDGQKNWQATFLTPDANPEHPTSSAGNALPKAPQEAYDDLAQALKNEARAMEKTGITKKLFT